MVAEKSDGKRKGGGGKLTRSETVTVRFDPKLRHLAELAARKHRRTLSSYIEWAVEESLSRVQLRDENTDAFEPAVNLGAVADSLWDVDEADRLAKLALQFPELLTHEEQILWKLVRENGYFWLGRYDKPSGDWTWRVQLDSLIYPRLREHWATLNAIAKGEMDKSSLPAWAKSKPKPAPDPDPVPDDDIPF